ncbi:DNA-binding NarL/FixJ family response regulator [Streptacidiphilus sp. MAP12-20]|uniref:helix-turn-helix domain-containing protein n=1 Tax=Streptacidiphilus sp. MAP12-20 TaxID=3156299 RepID=UPI0035142BF9
MSEETKRVSDALDAVESIADPSERVRAMGEVMAAQAARNKRWQSERQQRVVALRDDGVSLRKIAAEVGVSLGTVQDILRGYSRSWSSRPKSQDSSRQDGGAERGDGTAGKL